MRALVGMKQRREQMTRPRPRRRPKQDEAPLALRQPRALLILPLLLLAAGARAVEFDPCSEAPPISKVCASAIVDALAGLGSDSPAGGHWQGRASFAAKAAPTNNPAP